MHFFYGINVEPAGKRCFKQKLASKFVCMLHFFNTNTTRCTYSWKLVFVQNLFDVTCNEQRARNVQTFMPENVEMMLASQLPNTPNNNRIAHSKWHTVQVISKREKRTSYLVFISWSKCFQKLGQNYLYTVFDCIYLWFTNTDTVNELIFLAGRYQPVSTDVNVKIGNKNYS